MRTIRELIGVGDKVYILLRSEAIRYRFMAGATMEGIGYGDGMAATERMADDVMALCPDGTICYIGWAGRMGYHNFRCDTIVRIDYEKYISGAEDYILRR